MTAEKVTSTDPAHTATQLLRGNGRGSSVPAVRVEGVVKRFGAAVALDGAALEVPAGMVFGLFGPNGAGKTTTESRRSLPPVRGRWAAGD